MTAPLSDPNFFYFDCTIQTGSGTGGSFTPGGAHPTEISIGRYSGPNAFYTANDHAPFYSLVSTIAAGQLQLSIPNPGQWAVPNDSNTTFRIKFYVGSRLNTSGSGGTATLQACWSGSATYHDLVVSNSYSQVAGSQVTGYVPNATAALTVPGSGVSGTVGSASSVPWGGVGGPINTGSGTAQTVQQIMNGGTVIGWFGNITLGSPPKGWTGSSVANGAWFQNLWVGGASASAALIWLDQYGNAHLSGCLECGASLPGGTGSGFIVATTNATISAYSATNGLLVTATGSSDAGLTIQYSSYSCTATANQLTLTDGTNTGAISPTGISCGPNSANTFTVTSSAVSCAVALQLSQGVYITGVYTSTYGVDCPSHGAYFGGTVVCTGVSCSGTVSGAFSGTWSGSLSCSGTVSAAYFSGGSTGTGAVSVNSLAVGSGGISCSGSVTTTGVTVNSHAGVTHQFFFKDSVGGYCVMWDGSGPVASNPQMRFEGGVLTGLV